MAAADASGLQHVACGRTAAWPNNHVRPELRTLRGRFLRIVLVWFLFGLWILGVIGFVAMWLFSGFCVLRWAWSALQNGGWADAMPPPFAVQLYLGGMALYEGYHYVTRASPHLWPIMRRMVRYIFLNFPYFRLSVIVFEEREEAKRKLRQQSNDEGEGDAGKDSATDHLSAAEAVRAVEENDTSPYMESGQHSLFAFHPHGVLTCGFSFNGAHNMPFQRADCRWLSAENLFWFPLMRDILYWMEFNSCVKPNMQRLMRTGQNLCLLPGGFEEATLFERGKHRVYLKNRFGFIKLALQFGYKVYPAYSFGEEYTYHAFPYLLQLRLLLNRYRVPGTIFFGQVLCFYLPCTDVDLITVVGKPLQLPHIEHPTKDDVRKYQRQYVQALQDLFDNYKGVYAVDPEATLEIY
ncbi:hypothetical protein BBJ28_00014036 [Nothophytophthora sp. Chile5]|nr:hypothetical protein BBJ28_00014036 [Nothophytophthora sp. Chile5]